MFNNGRTNVHDEARPGHPSLITENTWLNELAAEESNKGILKLVNRYEVYVFIYGFRARQHLRSLAPVMNNDYDDDGQMIFGTLWA